MNDEQAGRRGFLSMSGKFLVSLLLYGPARLAAQNRPEPLDPPTAPGAPSYDSNVDDFSLVKIDRKEYEKWLREMRKAAEELAAEQGKTLDEDIINKFDSESQRILEENGYGVVPNPPTDLRIE